jgi:hypothetical protein
MTPAAKNATGAHHDTASGTNSSPNASALPQPRTTTPNINNERTNKPTRTTDHPRLA